MKSIILKIEFFFILIFILSNLTNAQQIMFNRLYGGSGGEQANAIIQTYDGNFVFTGSTTTYGTGYTNLWLVKINTAGDTLWTKNYGYDWVEEGKNLIQMPDSGFVIIAKSTSASNGLYDDIWLLRTDKVGDTLWTKNYGELWEKEIATDIINTSDGGFAISAIDHNSQQRDLIWLMKFDANGDTTWTQKYGNILDSKSVSCVIQTSDNGYLLGGSINITNSLSANDYYLIKTDSLGDTLWTKSYGYRNSDGVTGILPASDGGYLVTGFRDHYYYGFSYDIWLLKISATGDSLWSKYFGGYEDDYPKSFHPTYDGEYIIGASFHGQTWDDDGMMLVKLDSSTNLEWTKEYKRDRNDWGTDAIPTSDSGFVLCGYTDSDTAQGRDAWVIKTDSLGIGTSIDTKNTNSPFQFKLRQNYPNPFNPVTKIDYTLPQPGKVTLTIFDCLGREVQELVNEFQSFGNHTINFNGSDLSSGVYYYQLKIGNNLNETKKMLLLR